MTAVILALAVLTQGVQGANPAWQTYSSDEGFSVSLPGNPIEQKAAQPSPAGPIDSVMVIGKAGNTAYVVMKLANTLPITEAQTDPFFRGVRMAQEKLGKLIAEKVVTYEGHPGREITLEVSGQGGETVVVTSRFYLVSPEVTFTLQVARARSQPAPDPREVAAFFDSLKLMPGALKRPNLANAKKMEFQPFEPPGAGFTALMPGKPNVSKNRHTANNITFDAHSFECLTPSGLFSVTIFEYGPEIANAPAAVRPKMVTNIAEAVVTQDKGKITKALDTKWQGLPAHRLTYTVDMSTVAPLVGEVGAVMSGAKVYVVLVKGQKDRVKQADVEKFFESFKVTGEGGLAAADTNPSAEAPAGGGANTKPGPAMARRGGTTPGNRPAIAGTTSRARRSERVDWKRFTSAAGGFNAMMPGEPKASHEDEGLLGAKDVQVFTAQNDQAAYIVQYQDLPRSVLKKGVASVLKSARVSDEKVINGKVATEKDATLKGALGGRSYQIEAPGDDGVMARVRSYLVGERLYQVIVVAPKSSFPATDSERFFRSFRLQDRK